MAARQARHTGGLLVRYVDLPGGDWNVEVSNGPEIEAALQAAGETHAAERLRRLVQESKLLYEAARAATSENTADRHQSSS
jgi:hypothetical protein